MDNFYMLWQRKNSVFTGEFACCRLGHKRKGTKGELMSVICDKDRIRPLVRALWDRKIAHLAACGPFVVFLFHWRWASHADMMMADVSDDVEECNDQLTRTLDDMICKYALDETHRTTFHSMFPMFSAMFTAHPSMDEPEGTPCTGGAGSAMKAQLIEWFDKWDAVAADSRKYQVAWATCFAVAEGNLRMLQLLHEEHGADLTLGFCWGITLLDFASGKGPRAGVPSNTRPLPPIRKAPGASKAHPQGCVVALLCCRPYSHHRLPDPARCDRDDRQALVP